MSAVRSRSREILLATLATALTVALASPARTFAASPWWHLGSETVPASLPPGGEGQISVIASNLGDAPIDDAKEPVNIAIKLPPGLTALAITGTGCSLSTLTCSVNNGVVEPYGEITVSLRVKVAASGGSLPVQASVVGGGAAKTTRTLQARVTPEAAAFGVEEYELAPLNENGTPATQAGAHPFQLTTTLVLNQANSPGLGRQPIALPKDFSFHLPAGFVGNANAAGQCTMVNFFTLVFEANLCAPGSVVGVATVTADEPKTLKVFTRSVPVFNLVPPQGEPARFGFEVAGKIPVVIDTSVRSGSDYGVDVSVENATQTAGLLSSQVTFWGVPGDPRHNDARGWECVAGGMFSGEIGKPCPATSDLPEEAFLTLPSSCASDPQTEPVTFPLQTDSWANPGSPLGAEYAWISESGQPLGFEGCAALPFDPSLDVTADENSASTPTGLDVSVKVPQTGTLQAGGLAEADVRDATVTLPQGVMLSPSAANGLGACSEAQVGYTGFDQASQTDQFNTSEPHCPSGSKVGTVSIKTPLLSHELEGAVYLASPAPSGEAGRNPFNSLVALYLVAEDPVSGVLLKLAGEGHLDEGTLRVSTTFRNTPQVPFEELRLHLFGGPRASLTSPARCGEYATDGVFRSWSSPEEVSAHAPGQDFGIVRGAGGSDCPAGALAFTPGFTAYGENTQAGAFSAFEVELSRPDQDQALGGLTMHLPSGIAALLSSVELCSDAQASVSACPASSEVGQATAMAGLGSEPYVQGGGRVFITGPYGGAPFGLEIVTPANAGPFDLGNVTVRAKLYIDPNDASVTIVSDPLPTQIKGIPLQLKRVLVNVNRPSFEFNPTNCSPMSIQGTLAGTEGAHAPVQAPFQVGGCGSLPFHPSLTASTQGQASKANGASLNVKVESKGLGQANIAKVRLQLPKALPARLTTLQKACIEAAFTADPASCPEGSVIGTATIQTPVLKRPLSGPAYLVSHGGAAFPDVEFVLQGEGITLVLDGKTQISKQITYSKFESAPDAPFTVFETRLPAGPHSALTTNLPEKARFNLCKSSLSMPTEIVAQNGAVLKQTTKIALQGCKTVKSTKPKKLTRAQLLKRALASCRKLHKQAKTKRTACESNARHRYRANVRGRGHRSPEKPNRR